MGEETPNYRDRPTDIPVYILSSDDNKSQFLSYSSSLFYPDIFYAFFRHAFLNPIQSKREVKKAKNYCTLALESPPVYKYDAPKNCQGMQRNILLFESKQTLPHLPASKVVYVSLQLHQIE